MSLGSSPISIEDVLFAFPRSLSLDLKILRHFYGARSIELRYDESSPLFLPNPDGTARSLYLPCDSGISFLTLLNKSYEIEKVAAFEQMASHLDSKSVLIDIGANVGLFARQCVRRIATLHQVHCYEPHPENYELLTRNLGGIPGITLMNKGLGDSDAQALFYEDPANAGNYSLNVNAMPETFGQTTIDILTAGSQEEAWLASGLPLLYKSDTQGFDEIIATALSDRVWDRVAGGSFELWRLADKVFDRGRFARILDLFPNKVFESARDRTMTTDQVMTFLDSDDKAAVDLLFWK